MQLNITPGKNDYLAGTNKEVCITGIEAEAKTILSEDGDLKNSSVEDLKEEDQDKSSLEAGPSYINFNNIPKQTKNEPREVFSLFTICAGKMG